jgi:hypothetical protein
VIVRLRALFGSWTDENEQLLRKIVFFKNVYLCVKIAKKFPFFLEKNDILSRMKTCKNNEWMFDFYLGKFHKTMYSIYSVIVKGGNVSE